MQRSDLFPDGQECGRLKDFHFEFVNNGRWPEEVVLRETMASLINSILGLIHAVVRATWYSTVPWQPKSYEHASSSPNINK